MVPARRPPASFTAAHRRDLAERLREARERERLSQEALSERAGIDRKTVDRIENGHVSPSHDLLVDLADALGVEVSWLVSRPDEGSPPVRAEDRFHGDTGE